MDALHWERVQAIFHEAVDLPEAERRAFVESAAGADSELARNVLALIEEDARLGSPLDASLPVVARALLGATSPIPERLGPYRIRSVLGEGGMGVVYLAEREDLDTRVAIKTLRDAWLSPARRERFAREQRLLGRLSHPNIARIYDAASLPDGTPYFVMEHVDGVSITRYCEEHHCTIRERLHLFRAVCEAVHFAHRHAIVHRDLKPSNVLVDRNGTAKLLDFGISKQVEELDSPDERTLTAVRLMTPAYAAPEQVRGDPVGTYTDVYALGVMLYELLTGRLPFDFGHATAAEADALILQRDPERPSAVVARRARAGRVAKAGAVQPEASAPAGPVAPAELEIGRAGWADLDVLCLTAMQKDPQRRYRTADALVRDVDHFLGGEPLEARPDTLRYRTAKFVRRNARAVALATLILTAGIGLSAFYTLRLAAARDAARAEAARTQRIQTFMLDLMNGGEDATAPAETLRVVTVIDRGVREARTLDREPAVQTELYFTLGGLYQKLGRLDRADSLLSLALSRWRALGPDSRVDVARGLVALGLLRADQARLPEADTLVRQGLELSSGLLPARSPIVLHARASLGHVLQEHGDYAQAITLLRQTAHELEAVDSAGTEYETTLRELADTHFYAGDYAASDSLNQRLLLMDRQRYGPAHPRVADDLINLGATQFEVGHYTAAERYYRQALAINLPFYGPEHPEYAADLTMLARALVHEGGREAEARQILDRALAIRERVYGPDHPQVASVLNELGALAQLQDSLQAATAYFERMVAIYRKTYGGKHYLLGIALSNLAGTYLAGHRYAEAEPIFRQAIAMFGATLSPTHMNTGIARIKLGRVLNREHRWAEAASESQAGYDIVARQSDPASPWLVSARKDLVVDYDSLGRPTLAARYRAQLADTARAVSVR